MMKALFNLLVNFKKERNEAENYTSSGNFIEPEYRNYLTELGYIDYDNIPYDVEYAKNLREYKGDHFSALYMTDAMRVDRAFDYKVPPSIKNFLNLYAQQLGQEKFSAQFHEQDSKIINQINSMN